MCGGWSLSFALCSVIEYNFVLGHLALFWVRRRMVRNVAVPFDGSTCGW